MPAPGAPARSSRLRDAPAPPPPIRPPAEQTQTQTQERASTQHPFIKNNYKKVTGYNNYVQPKNLLPTQTSGFTVLQCRGLTLALPHAGGRGPAAPTPPASFQGVSAEPWEQTGSARGALAWQDPLTRPALPTRAADGAEHPAPGRTAAPRGRAGNVPAAAAGAGTTRRVTVGPRSKSWIQNLTGCTGNGWNAPCSLCCCSRGDDKRETDKGEAGAGINLSPWAGSTEQAAALPGPRAAMAEGMDKVSWRREGGCEESGTDVPWTCPASSGEGSQPKIWVTKRLGACGTTHQRKHSRAQQKQELLCPHCSWWLQEGLAGVRKPHGHLRGHRGWAVTPLPLGRTRRSLLKPPAVMGLGCCCETSPIRHRSTSSVVPNSNGAGAERPHNQPVCPSHRNATEMPPTAALVRGRKLGLLLFFLKHPTCKLV